MEERSDVKPPVVLALDFGGTKIAAAVAELHGERLAEGTTRTEPSRGARWNLHQGLSLARRLLEAAGRGDHLVAIGASTFGIPTGQGVLLAPAIPGWEKLVLTSELSEAFACDAVAGGTDVKVAAQAEASSGALVGADPGVYLNLGTGLAIGIVCRGIVVDGANGAAGEIGYSLRQLSDVDLGRGQRDCLEDAVSGGALSLVAERETGLGLTAAEVFARQPGNEVLVAALDAFVRELAFHTVNLAVALNPTRIAVGGGMTRSWDRIGPGLRRALDTHVPFPPELVLGAYPHNAPLLGAVALALREAGHAGHQTRGPAT